MWIEALAYGGPSMSTNFGRPAAPFRICPYRSSRSQASSIAGSRRARSAFIGKSVFGRFTVFL